MLPRWLALAAASVLLAMPLVPAMDAGPRGPDLVAWLRDHPARGATLTTWTADGPRTTAISPGAAEAIVEGVEQRLAHTLAQVPFLLDQAEALPEDALALLGTIAAAEPSPRAVATGKNLGLSEPGGCGGVLLRLASYGYGPGLEVVRAVPLDAPPEVRALGRFCDPQVAHPAAQEAVWAEVVIDARDRGDPGYFWREATAQVGADLEGASAPFATTDLPVSVVRGLARAYLVDWCDFYCFSYMVVEGDGATLEAYGAVPPGLGGFPG